MFKSNLRSALLGSGAAVAMVAAAAPVSAGEIDGLKAQIDALQNKLDALETRQDAADSRGTVAPAAAVEAGDKPKSWKLPGTNTSLNVGGYAKLDFIYDIGPFLGDSAGVSGLATNNSVADRRDNTFRAHAKQSRVWVKSWTPTDWGEMATHIEFDFEGGGGNQVVSNSTHPRLRHAYGRLGPILAGQTWSNFMGYESNASTIDFSGPVGTTFVRQAQIRYTHVFGGSGFTASVAAENAETTTRAPRANAGPGSGSSTGAGNPVDRIPDFTGKLVYKHSKGVVVGRALVRYMGIDDAGVLGQSDQSVGWALGMNGTWAFGAKDSVGAEFNYGDGIGRYMIGSIGSGAQTSFGGAGNPTAGVGNSGVNIDPIIGWGGYVWWSHKWTDTIKTNLAYGHSQVEFNRNNGATALGAVVTPVPTGSVQSANTLHANVLWSPVKQVNFGIEAIYGQADHVRAGSNDAVRLQIGMQYKF